MPSRPSSGRRDIAPGAGQRASEEPSKMSSSAGYYSLARVPSQTPSSPAHSASNAPVATSSPTARQSSLVARVVSRMTARARPNSATPTHSQKATPKATPNATPSHSRTLAPSSSNASSAVTALPTTDATPGAYASSGGSSQAHAGASARRRMPKQPTHMHALYPPPDLESPTASPPQSPRRAPSVQTPMMTPNPASAAMQQHPRPSMVPQPPPGQPAGDSSTFSLPPHCPSPGPRSTPPKRSPSILTATTRDITSTTQEISDTISVPLRPPAHAAGHALAAHGDHQRHPPQRPLAAIPPSSSSSDSGATGPASNHYTPADPPPAPPRSQSPGPRFEPPRPRSLLVPAEHLERTASPPPDTFAHFQVPHSTEDVAVPPRPHSPAPAIVRRSPSPPLPYPSHTRASPSGARPRPQQLQPSPFGDFDAAAGSPAHAFAAFDQSVFAAHDGKPVHRHTHSAGQHGGTPLRQMHAPDSTDSHRSARTSSGTHSRRNPGGPVRYRSGPPQLPAFAVLPDFGDPQAAPPPEPQQTAAEAAAAGGGAGCSVPLPHNSELRTHASSAGGGVAGQHPDSRGEAAAPEPRKPELKAAKSFYQPVGIATIGGCDMAAAEAAAVAASDAVRANAVAQAQHLRTMTAGGRPASLYSKNLVANSNITPDAYSTLPANFDMPPPPAAAAAASLRPAKAAAVTYRQRGFTTLPVGAGLYSTLHSGAPEEPSLWRNTGPAPLSVGAVAVSAPGGAPILPPASLSYAPPRLHQGAAGGHGRMPNYAPTSVPSLYRSSSRLPYGASIPAPRTLAAPTERRLLGAAARMHGERNTPEPPRSPDIPEYSHGTFLTMRERIAAMHGVRSQTSLYTSATPRGPPPSPSATGYSPPAQRLRTGRSGGGGEAAAPQPAPLGRAAPAPQPAAPPLRPRSPHASAAASSPAHTPPLSPGHHWSRAPEPFRSEIVPAGDRGYGNTPPPRMRPQPYGGAASSASRASGGSTDRRVMRRRTTAMLAATSNADAVSKAAHEAAAAALAEEQRMAAMYGAAGSKRRLNVSGVDSSPSEMLVGPAAVGSGSGLAAVPSVLEASSTLGSSSSTLSRREAAFAVVMGRASNVYPGGVMERRAVGSPAASIDRGMRDHGDGAGAEFDGRARGERWAQRKDSRQPSAEYSGSPGGEGGVSSPFAAEAPVEASVDGGRFAMHLADAHGQWLE